MQLPSREFPEKKRDWRIAIGTATSVIWLVLLALYLTQRVSWQEFLQLPLDQIGSFLGGAFSPLAFLWLVIGFFIQQGEIDENARNIETQTQHNNLDNFLKMADIVYRHLGVISSYIYFSCPQEMKSALGEMLNVEDSWSRSNMGDTGIFGRNLLRYQVDEDGNERDMANIFFGTPVRRRHSENYKQIFADLLKNASLCDETGNLHNALIDGTVWGILYKAIITAEPAEA